MNIFYSFKFELDEFIWEDLSRNPNPSVIYLLEENFDKINWYRLSENANAMHLLEANLDKIYWNKFCKNIHPKAIEIIDKNINNPNIDWHYLSLNPSALKLFEKYKNNLIDFNVSRNENPKVINFLRNNPNLTDWKMLSENKNAIDLLKENKDKIDWISLSYGTNDIKLLRDNFDKIAWGALCKNSNDDIVDLLAENPDKIDWKCLSINTSKKAMKLLEEYIDEKHNEVCWYWLSQNPSAVSILEKYPDKIDLDELQENSGAIDLLNSNIDTVIQLNSGYCTGNIGANLNCLSVIIKYHYDDIKKHFYTRYGKELIEWIYNPKNMNKWGKDCWDLEVLVL